MWLVQNAENHRFEQNRHSVPWGHIYLHVFLKLRPICFFESLVDPKLVGSRSEVSDLFLYTVAFQIHMIVFLSCVLEIEVEAIYIQNAFHDNISLQPSHVLWNSSVKDCFFCYSRSKQFLNGLRILFFLLHNFLLPWLQQLGLLLNWLPLRTFAASTVKKVYWKVMLALCRHKRQLCRQIKRCIELKRYLCILS